MSSRSRADRRHAGSSALVFTPRILPLNVWGDGVPGQQSLLCRVVTTAKLRGQETSPPGQPAG